MLKQRVIPTLLLSGERLVKTQRFKKPVYVGDPVNAIRIFNDKEVDELILTDIDASRLGKEPNYGLIERIAGECFMPLCYGGGIRRVQEAQRLFALGVEKIALQTAVLGDLKLVTEVAALVGSQSVVLSIDVKRDWLGRRKLYSSTQRRELKRGWQEHLEAGIKAGAGEILLTAVHQEGTMQGMDVELIREAAALSPVPLVAAGGVGRLEDIRKAVDAGASAVGVGAFFVFHGPHRAVLITYPKYGEMELCLAKPTTGG